MGQIADITDIKVPESIAVIPDGNRRWAKKRGLIASMGHKAGVDAYRKLLENAADLGIKYVTFYAFSTENWKRSEAEVQAIMSLFVGYIKNFDTVIGRGRSKIRFIVIGKRDRFTKEVNAQIDRIERITKDNKDLIAYMCVDYGGRSEIVEAAKQIVHKVKEGLIAPEDITEESFSECLYTHEAPDPDLLIRTSGEERISNFLLWQLAYTEFYFTDKYWPDFDKEDLLDAITE